MNKFITVFSLVVLFSALVFASKVTIVEPIKTTVEGTEGVIDLGFAGPGQTLAIMLSRDSGEKAKQNLKGESNALWDKASVVESTLPSGWRTKDSLNYEDPLTVFVTIGSDAKNDVKYGFSIKLSDEYEGVAPQVVNFRVRVTKDVLDVTLQNPTVTTGVSQPAVYIFNVKNKGSSTDTFQISASDLPYDWKVTKTVLIPHNSEKTVYYEVVGNVQKDLPFNFKTTSISSGEIEVVSPARLITASSLVQEYKSTVLGVPLFPSAEQNIYYLLGFIANVLNL